MALTMSYMSHLLLVKRGTYDEVNDIEGDTYNIEHAHEAIPHIGIVN